MIVSQKINGFPAFHFVLHKFGINHWSPFSRQNSPRFSFLNVKTYYSLKDNFSFYISTDLCSHILFWAFLWYASVLWHRLFILFPIKYTCSMRGDLCPIISARIGGYVHLLRKDLKAVTASQPHVNIVIQRDSLSDLVETRWQEVDLVSMRPNERGLLSPSAGLYTHICCLFPAHISCWVSTLPTSSPRVCAQVRHCGEWNAFSICLFLSTVSAQRKNICRKVH